MKNHEKKKIRRAHATEPAQPGERQRRCSESEPHERTDTRSTVDGRRRVSTVHGAATGCGGGVDDDASTATTATGSRIPPPRVVDVSRDNIKMFYRRSEPSIVFVHAYRTIAFIEI